MITTNFPTHSRGTLNFGPLAIVTRDKESHPEFLFWIEGEMARLIVSLQKSILLSDGQLHRLLHQRGFVVAQSVSHFPRVEVVEEHFTDERLTL